MLHIWYSVEFQVYGFLQYDVTEISFWQCGSLRRWPTPVVEPKPYDQSAVVPHVYNQSDVSSSTSSYYIIFLISCSSLPWRTYFNVLVVDIIFYRITIRWIMVYTGFWITILISIFLIWVYTNVKYILE